MPIASRAPSAPDDDALAIDVDVDVDLEDEADTLRPFPAGALASSPPPEPGSTKRPVAPASVHASPEARTVLVVEDDLSIRAMIVRALASTHTVYEAEDGEDALRILAVIPPPTCIVSDWMMPNLNGLELSKRVRADEQLKSVPIVLLTARNAPLDVVQGINAGARHYLTKPFQMKELVEKVLQVGKR